MNELLEDTERVKALRVFEILNIRYQFSKPLFFATKTQKHKRNNLI